MKANEAPEKIWMTDEWVRQFDDKDFMGEDSVEYVRKDAFIEKACEFISLNVADYIDVTHKGGIEHLALQEKFIEGFKKYMKGE